MSIFFYSTHDLIILLCVLLDSIRLYHTAPQHCILWHIMSYYICMLEHIILNVMIIYIYIYMYIHITAVY